jgi:cob(I)alamin adenosyltransferase
VDELNSYIGLVRDQAEALTYKSQLVAIQDRLFTIGSLLAQDPEKTKMKLPQLNEDDIIFLEKEIDAMNEELPEMRSFVLPGGNTVVSFCHISRCICRRAERCVIRLSYNAPVNDIIVKYLNRLSDYLFVLSRKLSHDLHAEEIPWVAKM